MTAQSSVLSAKRTVLGALVLSACASCAAAKPALRVCADPNNLPFSNERREGFENRLAAMLAEDIGARVEYTWWAQRRGFVRNTLREGTCDLIMGVPSGFEMARTSQPYYRSTYVFVSREDRALDVRSFDDPRLRTLKVGVQMIGDDFANSPPAHALSARGMVSNVVGYSVLDDYSKPNPPAHVMAAVASGEVDTAIVWGPLAGYFARREPVPLKLSPVSPQVDLPSLPFVFDISMGVRRGDTERLQTVNDFITRRRADIDKVLDEFGVPRLDVVSHQARSR